MLPPPSWHTATYSGLNHMPKLLSKSLIRPDCLESRAGLPSQTSGIGHCSSRGYNHLKRFYSHDTALAASVTTVADGHGPADPTPRGFLARRIRAKETKFDTDEPALPSTWPTWAPAVPSAAKSRSSTWSMAPRRDRGRRQHKFRNWLEQVENRTIARREAIMNMGYEEGLLWEDVIAADTSHLRVLLAVQRAALDAEKATNGDDAAAAVEARLDVEASQLARLVTERREAFEEARAKARAQAEAHPQFLRDKEVLRGRIHTRCRICMSPHSLSSCPYLVEDPKDSVLGHYRGIIPSLHALFENKWELDAGFREAVTYLRSKFFRAPGSDEFIPLHRRDTQDAPPSAIPFLQEFDRLVWFKSLIRYKKPEAPRVGLKRSILQGFYRTTDDDGFPLMILFPWAAPGYIADDPYFKHEVRIMRSFATCWRKGQKSIYNQVPYADVPSISIMICESALTHKRGRWHTSYGMWIGQRAIRLAIASEQTWKEGGLYRSFHIGTKDNEVTGDYSWWSHGKVISQKWLDTTQVKRMSVSKGSMPYRRDLVRSTLRDVHEPARLIFIEDIYEGRQEALQDLKRWRTVIGMRAIAKYGAGSEQAYLCSENGNVPPVSVEEELDGQGPPEEDDKAWVPAWETITNLGRSELDWLITSRNLAREAASV